MHVLAFTVYTCSVFYFQDELVSPHSITFSLDGSQLYAGFKNCLRIYDTCRPGRTFQTVQVYGKLQ